MVTLDDAWLGFAMIASGEHGKSEKLSGVNSYTNSINRPIDAHYSII